MVSSQTMAGKTRMKEEGEYGTDGWTRRHGGDVTGELITSANGLQEEPLKEESSASCEFLTAVWALEMDPKPANLKKLIREVRDFKFFMSISRLQVICLDEKNHYVKVTGKISSPTEKDFGEVIFGS